MIFPLQDPINYTGFAMIFPSYIEKPDGNPILGTLSRKTIIRHHDQHWKIYLITMVMTERWFLTVFYPQKLRCSSSLDISYDGKRTSSAKYQLHSIAIFD